MGSSPAHVGKLENAIDLIAPVQTPVRAAANGTVTYVKGLFKHRWSDPMFWNYSNFIVIMHSNCEYTRYDHLAFASSRVIIGEPASATIDVDIKSNALAFNVLKNFVANMILEQVEGKTGKINYERVISEIVNHITTLYIGYKAASLKP